MAASDHLNPQQFLSWSDISAKHPDYARDEGIHWASTVLATGDEDAHIDDVAPVYRQKSVPLSSIRDSGTRFDTRNSRMTSALEGYRSKANMPPVVLVHKDGEHEVADGHHRVTAARHLGLSHIPAYVANAEDMQKH